jgi:hypothetical protein
VYRSIFVKSEMPAVHLFFTETDLPENVEIAGNGKCSRLGKWFDRGKDVS